MGGSMRTTRTNRPGLERRTRRRQGAALPLLFLVAALLASVPATCRAQEAGAADEYAEFTGMPVVRLDMETRDCPWCTGDVASLARDIVPLREQDPFSPERLRQSVDALKASRRYELVEVDVSPEPGGVGVSFTLKPGLVVRDIRVEGEYPLFTGDILRAMSVSVGDTLMSGDLEEQEKLLTELYRKEGYASPKVRVKVERQEGATVVIGVHIEPGRYYTLESIKIRGNEALLDAEILSRMRSWRHSLFIRESGRFREEELARDVADLVAVYRQRGYPECTIDLELLRDASSRSVQALLKVSEGPKYEVSITGNSHFWDYTLRKDIVIFDEGNIGNRGLRKSVRNMLARYRAQGYLQARIDILEERQTAGRRRVRSIEFAVTEGPRTLVEKVDFPGATAFREDDLREMVETGRPGLFHAPVYDPDLLERDIQALRAFYLKNGYTQVSIEPKTSFRDDRTAVSISFHIAEGPRTVVSSIDIKGLTVTPPSRVEASLSLKQGGPFVEAVLKADEALISELVSARGRPYVKVSPRVTMSEDRTSAKVEFEVDEGPEVVMGAIYFQGNFTTRTSVIRRELKMEPGQLFSLRGMLEGQKRVRDMQAFNSVQFRTLGIRERLERVTLLVDVQESEPYYYQGGLGYVTDRGVYAHIKAGDRNLFGLNKHLWTGGEVSQTGYKAETGLTQQRIFDAAVTNTSTLSYEHEEAFNQIFGTRTLSASTIFSWKPTSHLSTSIQGRYEYRDQFLQEGSASIPEGDEDAYEPRGVLVATPGIVRDTRDSFVRPTRGSYSSYSLDVSRGFRSSLDNFLRHTVNLRLYYGPHERLTFAWMGRYTYLDPYGKVSRIPKDQLAYLGGTMSVRGFDENMLRYDSKGDPVGGRLAVNTSVEARIELTDTWETALFFDAGTVRMPLADDAGTDDIRSSAGTAMRYLTPIGPIGVIYGHKLDRKRGEAAGRFHISVGYTF